MKKIKLSYMVIIIICLAILLVLNTMAVFAFRDEVLSIETRKDNMSNFIIKYDNLFDNMRTNATMYLHTNDERYKTEFYILRQEYIKNDSISLQYRAFTAEQAENHLKDLINATGFTLTSQAGLIGFNETEQKVYENFLDNYNQLIGLLTAAVNQRDFAILMNTGFDEVYSQQSSLMTDLSKSYIDRLNINEDMILANQNFMELTLILLSIMLLIFSSITFYLILKENAYNSYFSKLYNMVVENIDAGIIILDKHYRFDYMNPKYKEIMGVTTEAPKGKSLRDVFDQSIVDTIEKTTMYAHCGHGQSNLMVGGQKKSIAYSFFTIDDEQGNSKYVHLIQDATTTEMLQSQLRKQLKEIEFYSKAKDSFIANISHEIKTPINAILGMVHFLKSTRLSQNQKELVRKIETSSDILLTIISDVLDLSKIKNNSLSLYPSDFYLEKVIGNIEDMFSNQLSGKGLVWQTELDIRKELCLHLDKTRFVQVLVNLINNAYKFTEHGYIKLTVETLFESEDFVQLQFCVEDTGMGIAEKDISKLFHEFEQLENHLTKQHQGTGLGLYICKNIIESMDGRLWVKSIKNEGSKFYFSLPAKKSFEPKLKATTNVINTIPLDGNGGRVLVVEDTEINTEVAVKLLNDMNIACDTAADGLAAVEMCRGKKTNYYNVILMDIHMPNMDGYTAAHILKKEMGIRSPIIALTASDINDQIRVDHEDTIVDFILKPFKASAFYQSLAPFFQGQNESMDANLCLDAAQSPEEIDEGKAHQYAQHQVTSSTNHPFAGREEAIKNLGGLESIYYKHVEKFKVNYANSSAYILQLMEDQNYDEARRLAHSIKGLGGTLGMLEVQSASAKLEKAILKENGYDFTIELENFDRELRSAITAI